MKRSAPLYISIADYIEEGIRTERYNPNRRLPSEMELVRKFDTSRPTVVRAMIEMQNRGLIERRVGSGTFIAPAKHVPGVATGTLGLITSGLGNSEILDPICTEITRFGEAQGYTIFRGESSGDESDVEEFNVEQAETLAAKYIERGVRGVFFAPLERPTKRLEVNRRIATRLSEAGIAVVLLDRDIEEFAARGAYDLVGIDNFAAGFTLGKHLAQAGYQKVSFIAFPRYPSTTDLRHAGLNTGLTRTYHEAKCTSIQAGEPTDRHFVAELIKPNKPDAIVCSNDRTAALLMQTLHGLGVRVPRDIAVAGFDDVRYATLLSVPLTTMRQPSREIGLSAVNLMTDRLTTPTLPPRHVNFSADLIVRLSTSAVK